MCDYVPWKNIEQIDDVTFRAPAISTTEDPRVYLGNLLAKAAFCAHRTVDSGFDLNSLHSYFVKSLNTKLPLKIIVEKTRSGRNFSFRSAQIIQKDKNFQNEEVHYHFEFTFKKRTGKGSLKFTQVNVPVVPQPERLRTFEQVLEDLPRLRFNKIQAVVPVFPEIFKNYEIIPCNGVEFVAGPQREALKQHFWFRFKGNLAERSSFIDQLILAYISDIGLTYSKTNGNIDTYRLLGSLDHSGWIHDIKFNTNDFLLWEGECTMHSLGRAVTHNRIWTRGGELIASFTQEAITEGVKPLNIKEAARAAENRPKI
ncbi:unnamed protein product [Bursaphelenchus xylophilus]|uniref:(pine wood nematode) hypothetical protein n=1 Tax=Bursaphelenchus xylophilus TaxID=6326 RepID=A0A1I7S8N6_BURXY|nr:unnamed protein product [Bursaphelenchus xylophilus]CAG9089427.1 unnamed protein product [Bursaphelenchus xylophilus]